MNNTAKQGNIFIIYKYLLPKKKSHSEIAMFVLQWWSLVSKQKKKRCKCLMHTIRYHQTGLGKFLQQNGCSDWLIRPQIWLNFSSLDFLLLLSFPSPPYHRRWTLWCHHGRVNHRKNVHAHTRAEKQGIAIISCCFTQNGVQGPEINLREAWRNIQNKITR